MVKNCIYYLKLNQDESKSRRLRANSFGAIPTRDADSGNHRTRRRLYWKAQIIAQSRNPYLTTEPEHIEYLSRNKRRGIMSGQLKIRAHFGKIIGDWFDYLFVSPEEMQNILKDTDWQIKEFPAPEAASYFAIIDKK